MISLLFIACLADRCHLIQLPWDGSMLQCSLFGQVLIAQWVNEHPERVIKRGWRCELGRAV